jgi:hypothetical protein
VQVYSSDTCSVDIRLGSVAFPGAGINREQRKSLTGSPGQPWQITGSGLVVQAKFGQYLQDAIKPRSISQTEEAVEWEQVWCKEQVLPTPELNLIKNANLVVKETFLLIFCSFLWGEFENYDFINSNLIYFEISFLELFESFSVGKIRM